MIWCCFSHKSLQICVLTGGVPPFPLTINIQPSRPGICRSPVHVAPYNYDLNYFDLNYLSCRLNQRFGALNDFGFSHQGDMTGNGRHVRNGAVTRHLQAACLCLKCRKSRHFYTEEAVTRCRRLCPHYASARCGCSQMLQRTPAWLSVHQPRFCLCKFFRRQSISSRQKILLTLTAFRR